LIGFIIFWLLSLPTMWLPIEKARWFFHAKAVVAPIGGLTFLIWSLVKAGGGGEIIHQKATLVMVNPTGKVINCGTTASLGREA
jgi:NCS1 family nucleobase:cation symporter-1